MPTRKLLVRVTLGGITLLGLVQLVPYGRNHVNPPVTREVPWPDARTRQIAARACLDCHSNETRWPWYSKVAPMSWLVYRDVKEGRRHVNFSEWDKEQDGSDNTVEMLRRGKMPFPPYLILHPDARLGADDKQALMKGLQAIQDSSEPGDGDKTNAEADKD
jgi:hypothetical protein